MDSASAVQWRLLSPAPLVFHAWQAEELVLVFHPLSGDTHLLDVLSAEVLRLLQSSPLQEETLRRHLLEWAGFSPEEFPLARLQTILQQLEHLDLIEQALS